MTTSAALATLKPASLTDPDDWLRDIRKAVRWHAEKIHLFGRSIPVPRQVAWYGDAGVCYRYSGIDHRADGWPDILLQLREQLAAQSGVRYNFVLLNHYRDGNDYMGWHADDEPALAADVCSVSLGASRRFLFEPTDGERVTTDLPHGSVVMIPRQWRHCLPKTRKAVAARINLSFRALR